MTRTAVGNRSRVNFYFDDQVAEALKAIAKIKNVTYSELIRTACYEYVLRESKTILADKQTITDIAK